jgi:hypothetical protein
VEFSLPDLEGRTNIFKIHARSMSVEKVTIQIIFIISVLFRLLRLSLHKVSGLLKVPVLSRYGRLRFQRTFVSDTVLTFWQVLRIQDLVFFPLFFDPVFRYQFFPGSRIQPVSLVTIFWVKNV